MKKEDKQIWDWRWPETGRSQDELEGEIKKIISPYEVDIPPFCYPGTTVSNNLLSSAGALLAKQINAIGCHTHGVRLADEKWQFSEGEGGFDVIQRMEAHVIWMIASMIGGSPASVDGYFCGGGTEANIEGMWIGREWLKQWPDPMGRGIVVLTSPLYHYSIAKAAALLNLGHSQYICCPRCQKQHLFLPDPTGSGLNIVGTDEKGQMSISELEKVFRLKYKEGFRRFLIVPTVGTTLTGSIDPIQEIGEFISAVNRETGASFYVHVDASFAGFTVPFVNPDFQFGFSVPQVMSVTVDGDKMGRLPYPAGVFLCRKGLMSVVAREVNYTAGHNDDTVSGSRSGLAQILAWYLYQAEGIAGQRQYVQACLDGRDKLVSLVKSQLPWVKVFPCSPWVNFAPIEIDIKDGRIPAEICEGDGILAPYRMRCDFVSDGHSGACPRTVYKVCVMPHALSHIERFVADLGRAKEEWDKKH